MGIFKKNKNAPVAPKEEVTTKNHVIDIPSTPEQQSAIPEGFVHGKEVVHEMKETKTRNLDKEKTDAILEKEAQALKTVERTIEAATKRGENIADLEELSSNVADQSEAFGKRASKVKDNLWYKNQKMNLMIAGVILIVLLILFGSYFNVIFGFFKGSPAPPAKL